MKIIYRVKDAPIHSITNLIRNNYDTLIYVTVRRDNVDSKSCIKCCIKDACSKSNRSCDAANRIDKTNVYYTFSNSEDIRKYFNDIPNDI